ncbi:MAG: IPExxxVDY family protein [Bacteroidetes bacterium]|nr:IPExxxVDY family protein [Bacteroidota bacterium]
MAKKVLLDIHSEPTYYTLIGLACHLRDYRLSYHLNKKLEFSFVKEQELCITLPGKQGYAGFSFFYYKDEDHQNAYCLIANRSESLILVPEMKQLDFVLLVEGEFKKNRKDGLIRCISTIPNVLTAFEIKLTDVKNYENILTDIELHLINVIKRKRG